MLHLTANLLCIELYHSVSDTQYCTGLKLSCMIGVSLPIILMAHVYTFQSAVTSGVVQVGVLRPTLFTLYVKDL